MDIIKYKVAVLFLFFVLITNSSLFAQLIAKKADDSSVKIKVIKYDENNPSSWKEKSVISYDVEYNNLFFSDEILYIQFFDKKKTDKSYSFRFNETGKWKYTISTNTKILGFNEFADVFINYKKIENTSGNINIYNDFIKIYPKNKIKGEYSIYIEFSKKRDGLPLVSYRRIRIDFSAKELTKKAEKKDYDDQIVDFSEKSATLSKEEITQKQKSSINQVTDNKPKSFKRGDVKPLFMNFKLLIGMYFVFIGVLFYYISIKSDDKIVEGKKEKFLYIILSPLISNVLIFASGYLYLKIFDISFEKMDTGHLLLNIAIVPFQLSLLYILYLYLYKYFARYRVEKTLLLAIFLVLPGLIFWFFKWYVIFGYMFFILSNFWIFGTYLFIKEIIRIKKFKPVVKIE